MTVKEILDLINEMCVEDKKKVKSGIKIPSVKKVEVKDNYLKEINLLFSVIEKNVVRPIIENVLVTDNGLMATDLDCSVFIPNIYNIKSGVYNKLNFETKVFNETFDKDDFPIIKIENEGLETKYNRIELLDKLEKVIFSAAKIQDNLSVKCIRFNKDKICASDTYRLSFENLKSEFEYSLPLKSSKVLINMLKLSDVDEVRVVLENNQVNIFVGNYVLKSRLIDLSYPPVENILQSTEKEYSVVIKEKDIKALFENLYKVSKDKSEAQYAFVLNFKNKKVFTITDKNKFEKEINIIGGVGFDAITLNSKFILEYIKAHKIKNELTLSFGRTNQYAVTINDNYLVMPLAFRE